MEIAGNINDLSAKQLELVIESYPWFSYARGLLLGKIASVDLNEAEAGLRKCSAFIQDRKKLHKEFSESVTRTISTRELETDVRYVATPSEYFTAQEVSDASNMLNSRLLCERPVETHEQQPEGDFVTETLAKIYEEQEYYDQALDVYSKLILLYPQKSAYFADCVEKLQLKRSISNEQIRK